LPRPGTVFLCEKCGAESAQWHGRCPACGEWNTLVEHRAPRRQAGAPRRASGAVPVPAAELTARREPRRETGLAELDRVLGGGVVAGAVVLVAGDPGIGKSTLLLQSANAFAREHGTCLYVSGEESLSQVGMRGARIGPLCPELLFLAETDVGVIEEQARRIGPQLLVVDSVQSLWSGEVESPAGTVSQVRECAARLLRMAKDLGVATFLVGHVTKEGAVAGPRLLEHMVDTVLSLEGDRHSGYRLLRSTKNRFGSTDELGLFRMTEGGMEGVPDASAALLAERRPGVPGSTVVVTMEGSRPLLVEIQALVGEASTYGTPRRSVTGADYNRVCLMLAVLERAAGMGLGLAGRDVFVNVPGGVRVAEPAADLGIAVAMASSLWGVPVDPALGCVGEVGLTGEVRSAPGLEARLGELGRRGFTRCLAGPGGAQRAGREGGAKVVVVQDIAEALGAVRGRAGG